MQVYTRSVPDALHFTGDPEADVLIAQDPLALLVGFTLDQQVTVQQAFFGPLRIEQRLGTLDAGAIAATDPARLDEVFRQRPAIHRFPGNMARRVQELCAFISERYDGRAERVWTEASDADHLRLRIRELPGFGDMKVIALGSVLAKRFGVAVARDLVPNHPTLGDVDSAEALEHYQAEKRAHKAEMREKGQA